MALLIGFPTSTTAQPADDIYRIHGEVHDTKTDQLIPSAHVFIDQTMKGAVTGSAGGT